MRAILVKEPEPVWHNARPYGDLMLHVKGSLGSTVQLPPTGGAIGHAYDIDHHYWVWAQPAWAAIPCWCDP